MSREAQSPKLNSPTLGRQIDDAISGVQYNDLKPWVKEYVDNIRAQAVQILAEYGPNGLGEAPIEKLEQLQALVNKLRQAACANSIPDDDFAIEKSISGLLTNPFYDVLQKNGIRTQKEMGRVGPLTDFLEHEREKYLGAGLPEWTNALSEAIDNYTFDQSYIPAIKHELLRGSVQFIMPGAKTQLKTVAKSFSSLRPFWIKEGSVHLAGDTRLASEEFLDMVNAKNSSLVEGIPDEPYILFSRSIERPSDEYTNMSVEEQLDLLKNIQITQPYLQSIMPQEYIALQCCYTNGAQDWARFEFKHLTNLDPLDLNAYTSFISMRSPDPDKVFVATWNGVNKNLKFHSSTNGPAPDRGLRLVVRVPLIKRR